MSRNNVKFRSLTVGLAMAEVRTSWANTELTITDFGAKKKVTILVKDPNDLAYLRGKLNEIEGYWRGQLEAS